MARLGLDNLIDEAVVKRLLGSHEEIAIRVFLRATTTQQKNAKIPQVFLVCRPSEG